MFTISYYQTIYDMLRANGLTEAGALGMLGNWDCESNCEPFRVQGDFSPYRIMSKQYVSDVDSGKIDRRTFMYDQKGFGEAQWTYFSRKGGLYDLHIARGKSIGDVGLQVEYAMLELRSDFGSLLTYLKSSDDLYECTKKICYQFENPAIKNVDARYASANRIKGEINLNPQPVPPEPTPVPPVPPVVEVNWPPRTIDNHCSGWDEVGVLNSVLKCRGYDVNEGCEWTNKTQVATLKFQSENGLGTDGCVGPMSWRMLLNM